MPYSKKGDGHGKNSKYLVFYIPEMDKKVVHVIRVMYGGRDVDKELKRHTKYEE